jgi:hypothetical protein
MNDVTEWVSDCKMRVAYIPDWNKVEEEDLMFVQTGSKHTAFPVR